MAIHENVWMPYSDNTSKVGQYLNRTSINNIEEKCEFKQITPPRLVNNKRFSTDPE